MRRNLFVGAALGLALMLVTEGAQAACLPRAYTGTGPTVAAAFQSWAANVANFYGDLYSDWNYATDRRTLAIKGGGWLVAARPCIPDGGRVRQQPPPKGRRPAR
jgi:hypothetical protein